VNILAVPRSSLSTASFRAALARTAEAAYLDGMAAREPGFGVYVHWPFCAAKCPYCDFNSHVRHQGVDEPRFARAFAQEIAAQAALAPGRTVTSIFFGGGTPSLMKPATLGAILDAIAAHWSIDQLVEVTLEANPTSVEAERFAGYRAAGVNRVSLGVQALNDADLKRLGRLHSAAEALAALKTAQGAFERVSFDLIYARPNQSLARWRAELADALALGTEHLSLYQLTIEPDTPFAALHERGLIEIPSDDEAAALWELTQIQAEAAGRPAYEISNYAVPGAESRHNLVYWRYGDYVGIGPGAHARLPIGATGERVVLTGERVPERWLAAVETEGRGFSELERLDAEAQADEFLLMGLRLREGIDPARYAALAGRPLDEARIGMLSGQGFLERLPDGRLRATREGALVLDALVADLAV
jgi:putative oxygen-independent coproporphyrinogen III oxidase